MRQAGLLLLFVALAFSQCTLWPYGDVCSCFNNDHCEKGYGCLVPSCSSSSCGFPRVCFCKEIMNNGVPTNTSDCSPVNSGPCADCANQLRVSESIVTPAAILEWEYGTLTDSELDERLNVLRQSTKIPRDEKIQILIDFTHEQEMKK